MKKVLIGFSIIFSILLITYIIYLNLGFYYYSSNYFNIDYDKKWNSTYIGDKSLYLKNENGSIIQIIGIDLNEEILKSKDIYLELEKKFEQDNKDYKLINYDKTIVGFNYYDGYQYLFENNKRQLLLIEIVKDNKAVYIICSAFTHSFDSELNNFYDVINSIEL